VNPLQNLSDGELLAAWLLGGVAVIAALLVVLALVDRAYLHLVARSRRRAEGELAPVISLDRYRARTGRHLRVLEQDEPTDRASAPRRETQPYDWAIAGL
jgi:hypothetical protein